MGALVWQRSEVQDRCEVCKGQWGLPTIDFVREPEGVVLSLCVYCMAAAIQDVTRWKFLNVLAQWRAMGLAGITGRELRPDRQRRIRRPLRR